MAQIKTILMVDDDEDLLALLKRKLEKTGRYRVVTASEGSGAVGLARRESPDLILLDIEMPDMPGDDVAQALSDSEDTRGIPILFLSSMVTSSDVKRTGGIVGGRNMISKSMSVKDLVIRMESLLLQKVPE